MQVNSTNPIGFFRPISFDHFESQTTWGKLVACSEWYLSLSSEKAQLMRSGSHQLLVKPITDKNHRLQQVLKVASWALIIFAAIALIVKVTYRKNRAFHLYNAHKELVGDISISAQERLKLEKLLPSILNKKQIPEIEWLSTRNTLVFSLKEQPELIFKIQQLGDNHHNVSAKQRFQNAVKVRETIDTYGLEQLLLPSTALITLATPLSIDSQNDSTLDSSMNPDQQREPIHALPTSSSSPLVNASIDLLVEKRFDIPNSSQDHLSPFYQHPSRNLPALIQLVHLMALTGLSDSSPENNPLVTSENEADLPKIAILDTEVLDRPGEGLCTPYKINGRYHPRNGLLSYIPMEQFDFIVHEAQRLGISLNSDVVEAIKKERISDLTAITHSSTAA
jgi:hypothetical protein